MRCLRKIVTALLIAAGLLLGLMPVAAHAAGPGVTLFINTDPTPIDIPGEDFSGGVPLRSLLERNGVDPATLAFVTVTRADGGVLTVRPAELAGALIIDNGTTTRFVRGSDRVEATLDSGPLQINVNGGDISVTASASSTVIEAGGSITFSARVRFAPPGAQLSYAWEFGDGRPAYGATVTHVFRTRGEYLARVTVKGSGGSSQRCATTCSGTDDVDITVGDPPQPPPPTTTPNPGSGGSGTGAGSSGGTGSGGQGASGTGTGSATATTPSQTTPPPAAPEPPPPQPPPKKPFGVTISGVLINDTGATVTKLPGGTPAGAASGPRQSATPPADTALAIPLSGLLALTVIALGALRERRGVKLRVA